MSDLWNVMTGVGGPIGAVFMVMGVECFFELLYFMYINGSGEFPQGCLSRREQFKYLILILIVNLITSAFAAYAKNMLGDDLNIISGGICGIAWGLMRWVQFSVPVILFARFIHIMSGSGDKDGALTYIPTNKQIVGFAVYTGFIGATWVNATGTLGYLLTPIHVFADGSQHIAVGWWRWFVIVGHGIIGGGHLGVMAAIASKIASRYPSVAHHSGGITCIVKKRWDMEILAFACLFSLNNIDATGHINPNGFHNVVIGTVPHWLDNPMHTVVYFALNIAAAFVVMRVARWWFDRRWP